MQEIVKISLDNELDLILTQKRTMKLAELCGNNLIMQTVFATAVSEIARCAISFSNQSYLILGIETLKLNRKDIVALVGSPIDLAVANSEALAYVTRLMGELRSTQTNEFYEIRIGQRIHFGGLISDTKIRSFRDYFKNEPPLSPYDEIRKKNIQLLELSDKLKESENQYRLLTDTLPLMMFALNPIGEMTYSNKWLKDYADSPEGRDTPGLWYSLFHPEDHKSNWQNWERAQLNKTVFRAQARLKNKRDGKFLWHLISIVPIRNEKDMVTSWIGFFVDIHAQKLIEETLKDNKELKETQIELENYQRLLEKKIYELNISNNDLEQFAYIASHDLQEPLRKIRTFASLLETGLSLNSEQKMYFDKITSSTDRMSTLIRDVLNYSRLSKAAEEFTAVDLTQIIDNVKNDLEVLINEKDAVFYITALPVIQGNPSQLSQLFFNLISNSLKFSVSQPIIHISAKKLTADEIRTNAMLDPAVGYYQIIVADNGIGFEQQYAEQIFTIFQRLHDRQSYAGTGIGLALCKKILSNHRGVIRAESELEKGTSFYLYFPSNTLLLP